MRTTNPEFETSIQYVRYKIGTRIEKLLASLAPNLNSMQVTSIIDEAFALSMQMSLQRSRVQIVYPVIGDRFVMGQADLVSTNESEEVQTGKIAAIVNPGLAKWGDFQGKNLDQRLDIVPSLVFVEPLAEELAGLTNESDTMSSMTTKDYLELEKNVRIKQEHI
jgi:hypothetical protein